MDKWNVLVAGVRKIDDDPGKLIDRLRCENPDVLIQAADAQSIYGIDHVRGVLAIAFEAHARNVMIANKLETEVLLRLACTNQISEALARAGLKNNIGCVIAFSKDAGALKRFGDHLSKEFELDDSVMAPEREKKKLLCKRLGISQKMDNFVDYLLERAAILVKN